MRIGADEDPGGSLRVVPLRRKRKVEVSLIRGGLIGITALFQVRFFYDHRKRKNVRSADARKSKSKIWSSSKHGRPTGQGN